MRDVTAVHGTIMVKAAESAPEAGTDFGDGRIGVYLANGTIGLEVYGTPDELIAWAQRVERLAREWQGEPDGAP